MDLGRGRGRGFGGLGRGFGGVGRGFGGRGRGSGDARPAEVTPPPAEVQPASPDARELEERYREDPDPAPISPKEQEQPVDSPVDKGSPNTDPEGRSPPEAAAEPVDPNPTCTPASSAGPSTSGVAKSKVADEKPVVSRIGDKGTPLNIQTNYLRLKLKDGYAGLVEYHVTMEPSVEDVKLRRKLLHTQQCRDVIGAIRSFDGMVLFLPLILPKDITHISTHLEDEPDREIQVTLTFIKVKPMAECVIFFNILLHKVMRHLHFKELRREYYDMNMAVTLDQHKLVVWPGYAVTSENQEGGLMICVDTCNRVLRQDTVYDYYKSLRGDPHQREKFENFIVSKIVLTKYNTRCYKIDEVNWDADPTSTFEYRGRLVSYVEYLNLRYPDMVEKVTDLTQPMLVSKIKPRKNEKFCQEERLAALIPEVCYVTGLTEDQKANFKVMTDLAASTRHVPTVRVQNLNNLMNRLLGDPEVTDILGQWGLRIEKEIIDVVGRKVDGPTLEFGPRCTTKATPPDFSREATRNVYKPIDVKNYVIICTQRDQDKAKRFIDVYKETAGPLGIKMLQTGQIVTLRGMKPSDFAKALRDSCDPDKVHFAVILMPMQRDDVYSAIKRHCVADSPIPSQCILTKTLSNEKRLKSIVVKIALQINCKLGGSLWALRMPLKERIMFIGIDAAHDPLKKDPSVICLVASMNNECTTYFSKSYSSRVHQELADSLGGMTQDAITQYKRMNGGAPNRIVVFRDGGSMGALEVIGTTEVDQMKRNAQEACNGDLQNFTFTVVTKRISQRFFHKAARGLDNPPPGTIVDSVVTRRHIYDFYVVSQQVRQGTVNPTHFVVVDSEDPIKPDLIQKFAYVTSFMYYNWSGTVRVPAMVQYAHKLSALLIRHVKAPPHRDIANTLYYL